MTQEQLNFLNKMRKYLEGNGECLFFTKGELAYRLQGTEHEAAAKGLPDYRVKGEADEQGLTYTIHGVGGNSGKLGWLLSDGSCRLAARLGYV
ncbi:MAG: hypothetical protein OXF26_11970 [Alphaproteobacteria bacterium]|nr:hypothetical protein [Alphaproteobacteria bacterium]MCY4231563.1 hypothetical protein [Alphaproteobacteria bacterium]MCY4320405.1 hypothetical protein [Alphaproteobacteria bacterium]